MFHENHFSTLCSLTSLVVNDYRGILVRPNLFFEDWKATFPRDTVCAYPRESKLPKHVHGLALVTGAHPVRAGTELCASYGKGWWSARRS